MNEMKANKIWGKLNGMGAVPFGGKILTRKKIGFLLFKRESVFFFSFGEMKINAFRT